MYILSKENIKNVITFYLKKKKEWADWFYLDENWETR